MNTDDKGSDISSHNSGNFHVKNHQRLNLDILLKMNRKGRDLEGQLKQPQPSSSRWPGLHHTGPPGE